MRKTFVFKLYHCKKNKKLHDLIGLASKVYNHLLALQKRFYKLYKQYIPLYRLQKHLTKLKTQKRFLHWRRLGSQALQEIAERIDRGYKRFFEAIKKKSKRKVLPPRFKAARKYKSFTLKRAGYELLKDNHIRIGKNTYKFFKSRPIVGEVKTLTVKRDPVGDLYLCFSCEVQKENSVKSMTGKSAGFDFGLSTFCTSSDEEKIHSPLFFKKQQKALKQAHRRLSSKQKGSSRRKKAKLFLARLHRRIARQRRDFHFKLAKKLTSKYDYLYFEDLNLAAMQRSYGKKINDLGFYAFLQILQGYAQEYGKVVHFIDRFEPTSKVCSCCGHKVKELPLKVRAWQCQTCHAMHDRDINAAKNIHRVGASTRGLGNVRPTLLAIAV